VLSLLRPGKRPSGEEVEQILRHVIGRIRRNWPAVEIMVRGDSQETDFSLGPAPAVADAASATIMRRAGELLRVLGAHG
jgi:DDE family transposase